MAIFMCKKRNRILFFKQNKKLSIERHSIINQKRANFLNDNFVPSWILKNI
jgi:hypothetical protein